MLCALAGYAVQAGGFRAFINTCVTHTGSAHEGRSMAGTMQAATQATSPPRPAMP